MDERQQRARNGLFGLRVGPERLGDQNGGERKQRPGPAAHQYGHCGEAEARDLDQGQHPGARAGQGGERSVPELQPGQRKSGGRTHERARQCP